MTRAIARLLYVLLAVFVDILMTFLFFFSPPIMLTCVAQETALAGYQKRKADAETAPNHERQEIEQRALMCKQCMQAMLA